MDNDSLWEKFVATGRVEDYLSYCMAKGETHDND